MKIPLLRWLQFGGVALLLIGNISPLRAQSEPSAAPDATLRRALSLLAAAERGETTATANLSALVAAVRRDTAIPEHERLMVVARARGLHITSNRGLNRPARLAAYARLARELIAAYPGQSEPYESLLAVANDHPDATTGAQLAREILNLPQAPAAVKAGAQTLLARQAMVGRPLAFAYRDPNGTITDVAQFRGKVVVLYAWSATAPNAHLWVKRLLRQGTPEVAFIGLNFDPDRYAALSQAMAIDPDARQIYSPEGLTGPVADALHIGRVPCIYLIDRSGIVRSVAIGRDLPQQLARLLAEGGRS